MKYVLVLGCLFLSGCIDYSHLANDDIISASKKCTDAGLSAHPITSQNGIIKDIQCWPH